jgi:membrane protein
VLFVAGWIGATYLFALYVAHFSSYNATYGTLGGIAVLLLCFYLVGFALLVGAELNAVIDQQVDPEGVDQRRREVKEQAAQQQPRPDDWRDGHAATPGGPGSEGMTNRRRAR